MAGWNLKNGKYLGTGISEDEIWSLFNYVFSDSCRKTNTYKFGLIKSICDHIYNLENEDGLYFLSYSELFAKFAENYWNLVSKYKIKQMSYNGKSEYSKIETIILDTAKKTDIAEEIPFCSLADDDRKRIISLVTTNCKRCVVGALYNDFEGKFYSFSLKGNGIFIGEEAYRFITKYKVEIERLNYFAWARFLESVNDDKALVRLLEKLDNATPRRNDLSVYQEILHKEFVENNCFYCGKKLNKAVHVDHFIPWTFVKSDNLWNFVLACPHCNIRKSNHLASSDFVSKIEHRNRDIKCLQNKSLIVEREFSNYNIGLINTMWSYAKNSGFREKPIG
jgi:hypothetical protein